MLKVRLITIISVLCIYNISAQNPVISDLQSRLEKHPQSDTIRVNLLIELATITMINKDPQLAMKLNREADSLSEVLGYQHGRNLCLRITAQYYWLHGDIPNSLDALERFIAQYDRKDSIRADALYDVSLLWLRRDPKRALEYNRELEVLSKEVKYQKGQISALKMHANYNWNLSNFDSAFYYEEQALFLFKEWGKTHMLMESYNNLGVLKRTMGDHPQAMEYYQKALKIAEEKGDKLGMGSILNNMGSIYQIWNDYDKMFDYYERALQVQLEHGSSLEVAKTYKNMAVAYSTKGAYEKALEYHRKALDIALKAESVRDIGYGYSNMGNAHINLGNVDSAEVYLQQSLKIAKELGLKTLEAQVYNSLANVRFLVGDMDEAYQFAHRGFTLASEIGEIEMKIRSANFLAQSAAAIGRYEEAYEYLLTHETLKDSIQSEENTRKLISLELQYKYDSEKELTAVEILRQKSIRNYLVGSLIMAVTFLILLFIGYRLKRKTNRKLKLQQDEIIHKNKELVQLNADKDSFVNILAHDLRGPMGSMLSLSKILMDDFRSGDHSQIEAYLALIHQTQEQSTTLLNDLLTWSRSKSGMLPLQPKLLKVSEICKRVISEKALEASQKNIQLNCRCDDNEEVYADRNMIESIFRNLMSNAIKFTGQGGSVDMRCYKKEDATYFSVKDTGIGMTQESIDKLWNFADPFTTKGTNNEKGTGLGLLICKELVEKHGGKIWVECNPGAGCEFIFSIPNEIKK